MRKCEICGKEVSRINLVKVAEFETMQMCDDCIEDEEVVQIIDDRGLDATYKLFKAIKS